MENEAINGQGLDILEEFGIHVNEKKPTSISVVKQAIESLRKNLDNIWPKEQINSMLKPVEDLLEVVEKWERQKIIAGSWILLILSILIGYLNNPTIIDGLILDSIRRCIKSKNPDLFAVLKEASSNRDEWSKIIGSIQK